LPAARIHPGDVARASLADIVEGYTFDAMRSALTATSGLWRHASLAGPTLPTS
jgi:hypothetical protein